MPVTFTPPTLLSLGGVILSDYSARGLTMTLTPITAGAGLRRTINGGLLDLHAPQMQKFAATITCSDVDSPDLADIWQGHVLSVTCIPNMGPSTSGQLSLSMMVDSWNVSTDEWACTTTWTINLLEI